MTVSYMVALFRLLPDEKQTPLPSASFENFKEAMDFYKEKRDELLDDVDKLSPTDWFIFLSSTSTRELVDEDGSIEYIGKSKTLKYEGNI